MLNSEQLQQVERYVAGKGIRYFDIQIEITDHLAEQVEAAMREKGMSFMEALREQGAIFSQDWPSIVEYKKIYARRKIWRAFRVEVLRYFTGPKIGVLLLTLGAMLALNRTPYGGINNFPLIVILTLPWIRAYYLSRSWKSSAKKNLYDPNFRRLLLIGRQYFFVNLHVYTWQLSYYLLLAANLAWWSPRNSSIAPPTVFNTILFYSYPIVLALELAWKKAGVELNRAMRQDYPTVLT